MSHPDPHQTETVSESQRLHRSRAVFAAGLVGFAVGLSPLDILGSTRGPTPLANARQLVMYLLHSGFSMSLAHIAVALRRDRSTVAHGIRRVEDRREAPAFDRWVECLEETLRSAPDPVASAERGGHPASALLDGDVR